MRIYKRIEKREVIRFTGATKKVRKKCKKLEKEGFKIREVFFIDKDEDGSFKTDKVTYIMERDIKE
jgi:hypothetical protein